MLRIVTIVTSLGLEVVTAKLLKTKVCNRVTGVTGTFFSLAFFRRPPRLHRLHGYKLTSPGGVAG